jgi:2-phosphosulfolactate phosphatase
MDIQILQLLAGARAARGLTVIIDVFRAFSLECYLFDAGVERIYAVGAEQTARDLKAAHPDYVLAGERKGIILPGFDCGNSPSQNRKLPLRGRTVVHTTSAGTQGLVNAAGADEIVTGSLVNAAAIARYIRQKQPEQVSLVCMGLRTLSEAAEDTLCARYIKSLLEGAPLDMPREVELLRQDETSRRFFDPAWQDVFPQEDWYLCTEWDKFDFVLQVRQLEPDIFEVTKH